MVDLGQITMRPEVQFLKPMGFNDYNALVNEIFAVLSDSGTISQKLNHHLNFPALNIP
jgi:UDP-N-acetylglucosamine 2-epimerase (non-hydrolysing)